MNAIGRNEPCPCGSGKKYKKCCLERDEALERQNRPAVMPAVGEDDFIVELLPKVDEAVDRLLIRVEKGQYEGVEAGIKALLREHPQHHTANFAMGAYLLATREDTEGAIPFFQKAVSVFPPMAEAHYNLGSCYIKSCRIPEAVASFRKAIRYSANNDLVAGKARDQLQYLEKLLTDRSPFQTLDAYIENQKLFDLAFENLQARRFEVLERKIKQLLVLDVGIQRLKRGAVRQKLFQVLELIASLPGNKIIIGRIPNRLAEGCHRFWNPTALDIARAEIVVRLGHRREHADRLLEERDGSLGVLPSR